MARDDAAEKQMTIGVPKGLAEEVDRFIAAHPEFGIKFRAEFFHFAGVHFLEHLNKRLLTALVVEAAKSGKTAAAKDFLAAAKSLGLDG
jgi:hypothetical protein